MDVNPMMNMFTQYMSMYMLMGCMVPMMQMMQGMQMPNLYQQPMQQPVFAAQPMPTQAIVQQPQQGQQQQGQELE